MPKFCNSPEDCPFEAEKVARIYMSKGYTSHLHRYLRHSPTRLALLIGALAAHGPHWPARLQRDCTHARHNGPPMPQISRHTGKHTPEATTGAPTP